MTRAERIKQLQEHRDLAKDLINFIKDQDQTDELEALTAWLKQEILMTELSITMTEQREGWRR